ncbi:MBL fold metallo-hydrolase [Candidatus Chloroploca sp. M-50]|uniref:MBL fold metallo-hydrolase n=1 Tax=Candidatus Chloroploca mongolica TaxID=2528176 RepID=A0ABS4DCL0_9CHLR|nr:MBL fold metallo-hydrolase [Candidatus Chloroploca mongolica]MBP1467173.1 MBL fold metallo-hydrolase [Candidatus Chloroploca mongolica]
MNQTVVRLYLFDTGSCRASLQQALRGAPSEPIAFHALVALIEHPRYGWILWDTGYAPRLFEALRRWPFLLYPLLMPLAIEPHLALVTQLQRRGIDPAEIRYVLVSHFHFDHISGLRDFPRATIVADVEALDSVIGLDGFAALRRAFAPSLLPDDFGQRVQPVYHFNDAPLPPFGATHDLFGDHTLRLVRLPGHARGQMGLLLQTDTGPVFLIADGAWLTRSIEEQRGPGLFGYLIADDAHQVDQTLANLHTFARANPSVTLIPTHCPTSYARIQPDASG